MLQSVPDHAKSLAQALPLPAIIPAIIPLVGINHSGYEDHGKDPILTTLEPSVACPTRGAAKQFPFKLYEMLSAAEEEIVSWQPHGRAFVIRDPDRLVNEIMPRYFAQSKIASFQRQLSLYGFVRITSGKDKGGYYHQLFLKGRPDLVQCLGRSRVKGTSRPMAIHLRDTEPPNFYAMEPCPPVDTLAVPTTNSTLQEVPATVELQTVLSELEEPLQDQPQKNASWPKTGYYKKSPVIAGIKGMALLQSQPPRKPPQGPPSRRSTPLRVPGRLRPQPTAAPAMLRFVPIAKPVERHQQSQKEAGRWTKPIQCNQISKELVHTRWEDNTAAVPPRVLSLSDTEQVQVQLQRAFQQAKAQTSSKKETSYQQSTVKPRTTQLQPRTTFFAKTHEQPIPPPTLEDLLFMI